MNAALRKARNREEFEKLDALVQSYKMIIFPILDTVEQPSRYLLGEGKDLRTGRVNAALAYQTIDRIGALTPGRQTLAKKRFAAIKDIVDAIYERNERLAYLFMRSPQGSPDREDFAQASRMGIFNAIKRYDVHYGYEFSTFAAQQIQSYIQRTQSTALYAAPLKKEMAKKVRRLEETESDEEIMTTLGITREDLYHYRLLNNGARSLNDTIGGTELTLEETLGVEPEENDERDIKKAITHLLGSVSERERTVLTLRYGLVDDHERTHGEIADQLNVSRERIRQIETKALRKLRTRARKKREFQQYHTLRDSSATRII
jgi:RNA polymerase primary sigma factor